MQWAAVEIECLRISLVLHLSWMLAIPPNFKRPLHLGKEASGILTGTTTMKRVPQWGLIYEYPSMDYLYHKQNAKERVLEQPQIEGFARTVTDQHKNIQGVRYHPLESKTKFVREKYPVFAKADDIG